MKQKKWLSLVLLALIVFSFIMTTSCSRNKNSYLGGEMNNSESNNNGSGDVADVPKQEEVFQGIASKETFSSIEETAEAYLKNEIDGNVSHSEFLRYENKGKLTEQQTDSLSLGEEEKRGLLFVEKIVVIYRETTVAQTLVRLQTTEDTYTQTLYLLSYEQGVYRYFVPMPEKGEPLSKSYFESVLDPAKYLNCTFNLKYTGEDIHDGKKTNEDGSAYAKVAGVYLYEFDKGNVTGEEIEQIEEELYTIFQSDGKHIDCTKDLADKEWYISEPRVEYDKNGNEITSAASGVYDAIESVLYRWFGAGIDYSYFEKTNGGFALREEKSREFIFSFLYEELPENSGQKFKTFIESLTDFGAEYTVFVNNGIVEQVTYKLYMESALGSIRGSYQIQIDDVGTTVIKLPAEIKARI